MLKDYLSGQLEYRDKIITHYIPLVTGMAYNIAKQYHKDVDIIISEATYHLIKIVDEAPFKYDAIEPLIRCVIPLRIKDFIREDTNIRIPESSQRRFKIQSTEVELTDDPSYSDIRFREIELFDCLVSDLERNIVLMRLQGYTDEEISNIVNVSRTAVSRIRSEIAKRFLS